MRNLSFQNYISLGAFCDVAGDLEKLGLRNQSSPFDWGISSFPEIIQLIENGFNDFMNINNLYQDIHNRNHYKDIKYNFYFFHDFNGYESLEKQYPKVKQKYDRRIERFFSSIKKPTLFFRYISSEPKVSDTTSVELKYIEDEYTNILHILKRFNDENEIVFISDDTIQSNIVEIFHVHKDSNDAVVNDPILKNQQLYTLLNEVDYPFKDANLQRYNAKYKRKHSFLQRKKTRLKALYTRWFLSDYNHSKVFGN